LLSTGANFRDPLGVSKESTSKEREGKGMGGKERQREGRGEVEGGIWPTPKFWCGVPYDLEL